jgi:hypothetical protein
MKSRERGESGGLMNIRKQRALKKDGNSFKIDEAGTCTVNFRVNKSGTVYVSQAQGNKLVLLAIRRDELTGKQR